MPRRVGVRDPAREPAGRLSGMHMVGGTRDQFASGSQARHGARRDGGRLPAMRARHPARARSVHGYREGCPGSERMTNGPPLTPLFEGGNYFGCRRWHDGRWWASDFYRHTVFTYDAEGREEPVL